MYIYKYDVPHSERLLFFNYNIYKFVTNKFKIIHFVVPHRRDKEYKIKLLYNNINNYNYQISLQS